RIFVRTLRSRSSSTSRLTLPRARYRVKIIRTRSASSSTMASLPSLSSYPSGTIQIKQDRVVPVTIDHARALGLSHRSLSLHKGASLHSDNRLTLVRHDIGESDNDKQVTSVKRRSTGSNVVCLRRTNPGGRRFLTPSPTRDFGHIVAVPRDKLLVVDEF